MSTDICQIKYRACFLNIFLLRHFYFILQYDNILLLKVKSVCNSRLVCSIKDMHIFSLHRRFKMKYVNTFYHILLTDLVNRTPKCLVPICVSQSVGRLAGSISDFLDWLLPVLYLQALCSVLRAVTVCPQCSVCYTFTSQTYDRVL